MSYYLKDYKILKRIIKRKVKSSLLILIISIIMIPLLIYLKGGNNIELW